MPRTSTKVSIASKNAQNIHQGSWPGIIPTANVPVNSIPTTQAIILGMPIRGGGCILDASVVCEVDTVLIIAPRPPTLPPEIDVPREVPPSKITEAFCTSSEPQWVHRISFILFTFIPIFVSDRGCPDNACPDASRRTNSRTYPTQCRLCNWCLRAAGLRQSFIRGAAAEGSIFFCHLCARLITLIIKTVRLHLGHDSVSICTLTNAQARSKR